MPFTVITLKKTPPSLRGDLTKWMQEIATGVYVGNFNAKIREEIWDRVIDSIGVGEATLSFYMRNEIGYNFQTFNTDNSVIDCDGIPLVMIPKKEEHAESDLQYDFSNASKFRKAKQYTGKASTKKDAHDFPPLVFIDIETDGLNEKTDHIIEIGAIKVGQEISEFHQLIQTGCTVPNEITKLTGIQDEDLEQGSTLKDALKELLAFIRDYDLAGYNIKFDRKFLNQKLGEVGLPKLNNKTFDIMVYVKKDNGFLENYKLETALKAYGIEDELPHRALEDAKLTYQLATKVNKFTRIKKDK